MCVYGLLLHGGNNGSRTGSLNISYFVFPECDECELQLDNPTSPVPLKHYSGSINCIDGFICLPHNSSHSI